MEIMLVTAIAAALASAAVFARLRLRPRIHKVRECASPAAADALPEVRELLQQTLRRELSLATEHLHSIRWLLEIARQHDRPIPPAALTNLDLVSKHLGEMQRRLEPGVSLSAPRRETPSPLHPRPPSFGCHVFPSDKSGPCG